MNAFKYLKLLYLCYFSKPIADRALYKLLRKRSVQSLVEIGVGRLARTKLLLELAQQKTPAEQLKYAGIDPFEARDPALAGVSLKQAHKELKPLGVKAQLIPGDFLGALARSANGLTRTDLVIISADMQGEALTKAWFYVPRMLHEGSQVFVEETSGDTSAFRCLTRLEVEQLASVAARSMRRAA